MTHQPIPQQETAPQSEAPFAYIELRAEHRLDALGIGTDKPRLSWIVAPAAGAWTQSAYEIEAYRADGSMRGGTGRVESGDSVLVAWPFAPLNSREQVALRVRAWNARGQASQWSEPLVVEAGLLHFGDWSAHFITPDWEEDLTQPQPGPLLRREFEVRSGIRRARLYASAQGLYEPYLNGQVVGDHVLAPGWTSYHHRLRYQTFDVTGMLHEGRNALGAMLGDGWYRGRFSFGGGRRNIYGDRLALLAQLEIEYEDGTVDRIVSGEDWRAARGPVQASDIYDGETYDARLEQPGWAAPGFDDSGWNGVRLEERDFDTLIAPEGPPVRRIEVFPPENIFQSPSGRTLVDFGQNLVGRLRLTISGPAGHTVTLRHAEVLENGELGVRPLRTAKATDQYILRGEGVETWEPRFTFHGFRYAEVENWPGELRPENIAAVVIHTDMERTGWFECSDPLINRLHENVVWSVRGNFVDVPTDCPQRDERLGWTGDLQVISPTASFLYNTAGQLKSWLADLAAEQKETGVVPFVVPSVISTSNPPAAAWGDAAVIVPWVLYQRFGDTSILAAQFESMAAWVDLLDQKAGASHLWDTGFQFGDWLDPSAPPDNPAAAKTPSFIVATAYFARSAEITAQAARVLGRDKEAARYEKLAEQVRRAFASEYVTPNGRVLSDASTAYALALEFNLLPTPAQRRRAGQRLAELVRESGYHISTGFVGTPLICDALCAAGEVETAFRLLTQRENPSWLYPVTMGATTIWERWDSMLPDGSINPGEMTSFNHYALGAVADWLHRAVAGLAPAAPGYREIEVRPILGGGLTFARARHRTPLGMAETSWKIADGRFRLKVTVPPNSKARVSLPGGETTEVGPGRHAWDVAYHPPHAAFGPLTADSTLNQIMDDPEGYEVLTRVLRENAPDFLASPDVMRSYGEMSLRQVTTLLPGSEPLLAKIEEGFSALKR